MSTVDTLATIATYWNTARMINDPIVNAPGRCNPSGVLYSGLASAPSSVSQLTRLPAEVMSESMQ